MAMTLRQRVLKTAYPLFVWLRQKTGRTKLVQNAGGVVPAVPFHSLSVKLNNGKELPFEALRGRKVLLVNTASDCGFTPQYEELQKLYRHAKEDLEILAFPANDFKGQEKGSDADIAHFCAVNYGISFPVTTKTVVQKSAEQHPVYRWLTEGQQNGWNEQAPSWNFAKYLVNEEGVLTHYFEPAVSPLGEEVRQAISA